jgi:hypothetical protein
MARIQGAPDSPRTATPARRLTRSRRATDGVTPIGPAPRLLPVSLDPGDGGGTAALSNLYFPPIKTNGFKTIAPALPLGCVTP